MRFYSTVIFVIALFFEILSFIISVYREKLNSKFIESNHDFLSVACHHILAMVNVIILVISFLSIIYYLLLILTILFSLISNTEIKLEPIINVPFSISIIILIIIIFITFEICVKRNERIRKTINKLCDVDNPNNDEKLGIIGNLRYGIIVYIVPITILLYLINMVLGVNYA